MSSSLRNLLDDVMTGHKTQLAASGLAPSVASMRHQGSAASAQQHTLQQLQVLTPSASTKACCDLSALPLHSLLAAQRLGTRMSF